MEVDKASKAMWKVLGMGSFVLLWSSSVSGFLMHAEQGSKCPYPG